jgi:hypothetical protein
MTGDKANSRIGIKQRAVEEAEHQFPGGSAKEVFRQQQFAYTREASRISPGSTLSPEKIREVCSFGLKQIFDSSE